eukprot:1850461-Prymnesium_polylepis.1
MSNAKHFSDLSQAFMPTSWVKKAPVVHGLTRIDLSCKKEMYRVSKLCQAQRLVPPSGFVKSVSFFYGKYECSKLTAVIGLS